MNAKLKCTAVIALSIASLTIPSLAHAKCFGSKPAPVNMGKAPVPPKESAPAAAPAPVNTPLSSASAAGPGWMGTIGAVAVDSVVGSMAGNALAGAMPSDKDATAKQVKEAEVLGAEQEAKELQRKADEARAKARAVRAVL